MTQLNKMYAQPTATQTNIFVDCAKEKDSPERKQASTNPKKKTVLGI
jgi:hypothetical protein